MHDIMKIINRLKTLRLKQQNRKKAGTPKDGHKQNPAVNPLLFLAPLP